MTQYYLNVFVRHHPGLNMPSERDAKVHATEREALDEAVEGWPGGWVYESTFRMIWATGEFKPFVHPLGDAIRLLQEGQRTEQKARLAAVPSWE